MAADQARARANVVMTTVSTVDRSSFKLHADLVEAIASHLAQADVVQVQDSEWPLGKRLRYIIQWVGDAGYVFDGAGEPMGVFADTKALVQHAETMTA